MNPLKQDLFVDLQARFTDMDLSPVSPYSGKYVGYVIEKGKLSFDLKYLIDKKKLNSENKVFVDQFTFGEKVESPDATRLPVKLAVALLKDRNGQIRLDIPVTGSIDDPQFSVFSIVLQVIGNLITKAVASPFALLGAVILGVGQRAIIGLRYQYEWPQNLQTGVRPALPFVALFLLLTSPRPLTRSAMPPPGRAAGRAARAASKRGRSTSRRTARSLRRPPD